MINTANVSNLPAEAAIKSDFKASKMKPQKLPNVVHLPVLERFVKLLVNMSGSKPQSYIEQELESVFSLSSAEASPLYESPSFMTKF